MQISGSQADTHAIQRNFSCMPHCYRGAWVSRAFAKEFLLAILTIIVIFTLSGSCWARYVQGNSCLLRAVCFEYPYKVYWHESFDGHVKQHHQKLDLGQPGGHSPLTSPNNSWGNLSRESPKVWPSQLSLLLCSWDCTVVTSDRIPCQTVLCVGYTGVSAKSPACVTLSQGIHHFGANWNPQRNTKGISAIYVCWLDANDAAFECCNGDSWTCGLPKINQNTSLQVDFCTAAAFCIQFCRSSSHVKVVCRCRPGSNSCLPTSQSFLLTRSTSVQWLTWSASLTWCEDVGPGRSIPASTIALVSDVCCSFKPS